MILRQYVLIDHTELAFDDRLTHKARVVRRESVPWEEL